MDLDIPGSERTGADLINELVESGKPSLIIPVTEYLDEFSDELPKEVRQRAIEKSSLEDEDGPERLRSHILDHMGCGKVKVIERAVGYVKEDVGESIIIRVKLPDGSPSERVFNKQQLHAMGIGMSGKFVEITTIQRQRGEGIAFQTTLRWLPSPPLHTSVQLVEEGSVWGLVNDQ